MENLPEDHTEIQERQPVSLPEQLQQIPQNNWWRIGFLVTVVLFLVTRGVIAFSILKTKKSTQLPRPPQVPIPSSTLGPISIPTPDPTTNWETYTNTKYGYSIKYPPALEIRTMTDHLGYETVYLSFPDVKNSQIVIGWDEKNKNETFSNWVNSYLKLYDKYRFSSPRDITIDAHSAISIDSTIDQSYTYFIFILKDDSNLIDLSLTNVPVGNTSLKPTFDQILSTFRFLD